MVSDEMLKKRPSPHQNYKKFQLKKFMKYSEQRLRGKKEVTRGFGMSLLDPNSCCSQNISHSCIIG